MTFRNDTRDSLFLSENPAWLNVKLCDGTNVPPQADIFFAVSCSERDLRLDRHEESAGWHARTERLLADFRQFRNTALPVGAILHERRIPAFGKNAQPAEFHNQSKMIRFGGGARVEPSPLFDRATREYAPGLFPFLDVNGNLMVSPDRRPLAFRFGLTRQIMIAEAGHSASDNRQLLSERLFELCTEAGTLLAGLPAEILKRVWHRWGVIRNLPDDGGYRWLDSLFEFEWSNRAAPKIATRNVWKDGGYTSLVLDDSGLFPRIPHLALHDGVLAHQFPSEGGYPFEWGSELKDIVSSSINFLEWIVGASSNERALVHKQEPGRVRGSPDVPSSTVAREMRFRVALSFPGERREFVQQVADCLAGRLGRSQILYDGYNEAEFARPNLDTHLQRLYHDESELIAVFLCADYEHKEWCGLEWRAIRDLIKRRRADSVMPLRFDNTEIPGLFSTDGYAWIGNRPADEIAKLILQRLESAESEAQTGPWE